MGVRQHTRFKFPGGFKQIKWLDFKTLMIATAEVRRSMRFSVILMDFAWFLLPLQATRDPSPEPATICNGSPWKIWAKLCRTQPHKKSLSVWRMGKIYMGQRTVFTLVNPTGQLTHYSHLCQDPSSGSVAQQTLSFAQKILPCRICRGGDDINFDTLVASDTLFEAICLPDVSFKWILRMGNWSLRALLWLLSTSTTDKCRVNIS